MGARICSDWVLAQQMEGKDSRVSSWQEAVCKKLRRKILFMNRKAKTK